MVHLKIRVAEIELCASLACWASAYSGATRQQTLSLTSLGTNGELCFFHFKRCGENTHTKVSVLSHLRTVIAEQGCYQHCAFSAL